MAGPSLTLKQQRFVDEYLIDFNATQAAIRSGYSGAINPKKYYVYFLINPITNRIFYVGKGKGKRVSSHLKNAKKGIIDNEPKYSEIKNIIDLGMNPIELIIQDNLKESESFELEMFFIKSLRDYGLTNISSGTATNAAKSKIEVEKMISKLKPFDEWTSNLSSDVSDLVLSVFGDYKSCYDAMVEGLNKCHSEAILEMGAK